MNRRGFLLRVAGLIVGLTFPRRGRAGAARDSVGAAGGTDAEAATPAVRDERRNSRRFMRVVTPRVSLHPDQNLLIAGIPVVDDDAGAEARDVFDRQTIALRRHAQM